MAHEHSCLIYRKKREKRLHTCLAQGLTQMFCMHTSEQRKDYIYNPKTQARLKCKYFNNKNLKHEWMPALTTRSKTTKSSWTNFSTTTGGIRQVNFVQNSVRNCINNNNNEACNALIPRIPSKQDSSRPKGSMGQGEGNWFYMPSQQQQGEMHFSKT